MKRTIGFFIGLALVGAGCGQRDSTSQPAGPSSPEAASPSATASQADPLEGEWRAEFTCQDSVRAIKRHLSAKQIHQQVGSLKSFLGGTESKKGDLCHGVTGTTEVVLRFEDGNIALFENGQFGAPGVYELVDERSISVTDPQGNFCQGTEPPTGCPVTWEFEIVGDELTFHVTPDAHVIFAWESASFVRVS